jgi:hypothetical protein
VRTALAAATVAMTAAVAILASGCGDAVGEFRREELNPLQRQADAQRAELAAVVRTARNGSRRDARLIEGRLLPLRATFAEMTRLDPPGEVEKDYAAFVEANSAFLTHMRTFAAALRAGDGKRLSRASSGAREAVGAALRALEPIRE